MPVTRLYLIRHGQSDGNAQGRFGGHSPTPLSDLGKQQADVTAKALEKEGIDHVYSSDLLRAVQTAQPLAKRLGVEVNKTSAFRERNVGVLEGLTFQESKQKYPKDYYALINRNINHVITDGESYRQLLRRGTRALNEIFRAHRGKRIAVFSHTGAICYLTLNLIGGIDRRTVETPWLVTSNCGINRFEIRGRRNVRLLAMNDTRHLIEITGNDSFVGG
ncbi:MAG: histidine phosphatase family protein [Acidobacteria bacterium]|nr:MAG: histidine phosphatase family protein [Acidobacteriota bacterium]REK03966.1 MAG: histidine phosphatase family protein [Acidobacteriota bacterium]REK15128.1 MAG: histidine phosphatase family protein [Acidobacteriota bacterium]REK46218.1 MAG: histidine phosphatase family protein [Acidobacteriota bacterium]